MALKKQKLFCEKSLQSDFVIDSVSIFGFEFWIPDKRSIPSIFLQIEMDPEEFWNDVLPKFNHTKLDEIIKPKFKNQIL